MIIDPLPTNTIRMLEGFKVTSSVTCPHPCGIGAVSAPRNWAYVYTGSADGHIRRYDFIESINGRQILPLAQRQGTSDTITKCGILNSSFLVGDAVASKEGNTSQISQRDTGGAKNHSARTLGSPILSLCVHSDAVWGIAGLKNGIISLLSLRVDEGSVVHTFRHHTAAASCLTISHDEKSFVSGSWDCTVSLVDLDTGAIKQTFSDHTSQITSVQYHTQSPTLVLSSSLMGETLVHDIRMPTPVKRLRSAEKSLHGWALSACWSSDGRRIFTSYKNERVCEWDVAQETQTQTIKFPIGSGPITAVKALKDNKHVLCASANNLRLWNMCDPVTTKDYVPFQVITGHQGAMISDMIINEEEGFMATVSGCKVVEGPIDKTCIFYEINKTV